MSNEKLRKALVAASRALSEAARYLAEDDSASPSAVFDDEDKPMRVKEVAVLLSCSVRSVYRMIEAQDLAAVNVFGKHGLRVKRSEVRKILEGVKK